MTVEDVAWAAHECAGGQRVLAQPGRPPLLGTDAGVVTGVVSGKVRRVAVARHAQRHGPLP